MLLAGLLLTGALLGCAGEGEEAGAEGHDVATLSTGRPVLPGAELGLGQPAVRLQVVEGAGYVLRADGVTLQEAVATLAEHDPQLRVRIDDQARDERLYLAVAGRDSDDLLDGLLDGTDLEKRRTLSGTVVIRPRRTVFALDLAHGVAALVLLLGTFLCDRVLEVLIRRRERASRKQAVRFKQHAPLWRVGLWVVGVTSALLVLLSVPPTTALALTGGGLLLLGFASKDFAQNLLGGLAVALDRPVNLGDYVQVGPYAGEVRRIGLRTSQLVTLDDTTVTVPNHLIASEAVASANYGALEALIPVEFFLAHGCDVTRVRQIVWEAVVTSAYCAWKKPVHVLVEDRRWATRVYAHGYVFDVRYQLLFRTDVTQRVKRALAAEGIPYPVVPAGLPEGD